MSYVKMNSFIHLITKEEVKDSDYYSSITDVSGIKLSKPYWIIGAKSRKQLIPGHLIMYNHVSPLFSGCKLPLQQNI